MQSLHLWSENIVQTLVWPGGWVRVLEYLKPPRRHIYFLLLLMLLAPEFVNHCTFEMLFVTECIFFCYFLLFVPDKTLPLFSLWQMPFKNGFIMQMHALKLPFLRVQSSPLSCYKLNFQRGKVDTFWFRRTCLQIHPPSHIQPEVAWPISITYSKMNRFVSASCNEKSNLNYPHNPTTACHQNTAK